MSPFLLQTDEILAALLVFLRVGGIIFALPIFGDPPVPVRARILLALGITLALGASPSASTLAAIPKDLFAMAGFVLRELTIGLLIGFVARAAFAGVLMAATIVSYQMGFGTATLMMPDLDAQIDSFSAFHRIMVILIFLSLDLHHVFFRAMFHSFEWIPIGRARFHADIAPFLVTVSGQIFVVALQLAAPILIALLFTMAGLGLVSRAVPQLNVFTMSFPVSFFIGMMIYLATFNLYPTWIVKQFEQTETQMSQLLRGMVPP